MQSIRSPRTLGLVAAIQRGTTSATPAEGWGASHERLRVGRSSAHMHMSSKAAGDMYANSVLSSSPLVAFRNFAHAEIREDSVPFLRAKSPPCCTQATSASQLRRQFDGYSENCSIRGNTSALHQGGISLETRAQSNKPECVAPRDRISRSLSTSRGGRQGCLQTHSQRSPSAGGQCMEPYEAASHLPYSLSPGCMRQDANTHPLPASPKDEIQGEGLTILIFRICMDWHVARYT